MAARITDIFPLLLITLLCIGIVEGGYQALEYFVLRPPAEKAAVSDPVAVGNDLAEKDKQVEKHDYRIIMERNLFGTPASKEEAPVAADNVEDMQLSSLNVVLMGTINGEKGDNRAIVLDKSTNKQELYEAGDVIQGAQVKEVLRGKVILLYNGKDEMLDMSEAANMRAGTASVARPRVGAPPRASRAISREPVNRPALSPRGRPGRVISGPRTIRPSRSIITQ
jgi:type II secretory pathway component PulC